MGFAEIPPVQDGKIGRTTPLPESKLEKKEVPRGEREARVTHQESTTPRKEGAKKARPFPAGMENWSRDNSLEAVPMGESTMMYGQMTLWTSAGRVMDLAISSHPHIHPILPGRF